MEDYKFEEKYKRRKESALCSWHQWSTPYKIQDLVQSTLTLFLLILLKKQYNQMDKLMNKTYYQMKTQTLQL